MFRVTVAPWMLPCTVQSTPPALTVPLSVEPLCCSVACPFPMVMLWNCHVPAIFQEAQVALVGVGDGLGGVFGGGVCVGRGAERSGVEVGAVFGPGRAFPVSRPMKPPYPTTMQKAVLGQAILARSALVLVG